MVRRRHIQQNRYEGDPPRPWINLQILTPDGDIIPVQLLADTGSPYAIIVSHKILELARQEQGPAFATNFGDYEAVGKSTHIQYIFPVSDTSLSISETVFCGPRAHPVGAFAQQREASGGPGGGNEPPGRGTDAAKS